MKVVGHRLLVKPVDVKDQWQEVVPESLKKSGFVIEVQDEKRHKMAVSRGVVIGIGEACWRSPELGYGSNDWRPWCRVGDEIIYAKYAGSLIEDPVTKEEYFLLNDVDVQAVVKEA